jgi:hypothetical protein
MNKRRHEKMMDVAFPLLFALLWGIVMLEFRSFG